VESDSIKDFDYSIIIYVSHLMLPDWQ